MHTHQFIAVSGRRQGSDKCVRMRCHNRPRWRASWHSLEVLRVSKAVRKGGGACRLINALWFTKNVLDTNVLSSLKNINTRALIRLSAAGRPAASYSDVVLDWSILHGHDQCPCEETQPCNWLLKRTVFFIFILTKNSFFRTSWLIVEITWNFRSLYVVLKIPVEPCFCEIAPHHYLITSFISGYSSKLLIMNTELWVHVLFGQNEQASCSSHNHLPHLFLLPPGLRKQALLRSAN